MPLLSAGWRPGPWHTCLQQGILSNSFRLPTQLAIVREMVADTAAVDAADGVPHLAGGTQAMGGAGPHDVDGRLP